ncbi:MAG TPA: HD domain-containing protein [Acidobacteriaceae bacterium]|jgi:putative hydrolase of HD superfamily|nr:HD domain-containing protein [Acidobacteriaceae bacterium]
MLIRFMLEIDKVKGILRKVKTVGEDRYENIVEHSRQIALVALSQAQTLSLKVDLYRAAALQVVHDIGEIDAGDEFVFARQGWEERKAAELPTVKRIFGLHVLQRWRIPLRSVDAIRCHKNFRSTVCEGDSIEVCQFS